MTPILGLANASTALGQTELLNRYSAAIDYLSSSNSTVITGVFNRMYVRYGFPIKPSFSKNLLDGFGAGAQTFTSPETAVTEINTAVANATRDKIPELVTIDMLSDAQLVLVSALYFKGNWKHSFPEADTRKASFLTIDGDAERELEVDMMTQNPMDLPYNYFYDRGFDVLSVPYTDPDYSMVLLRPLEPNKVAVQNLRDKLDTLNITDIVEQLRKTNVILRMPKFKIEAEYKLKGQLSQLGITKIFLPGADLTGMSTVNGYIDKVIHKVFIEVTEEGTEAAGAAAASRVGYSGISRPLRFTLDRPFFAVVYNHQHHINLFTAFVASPNSDASSEHEEIPYHS